MMTIRFKRTVLLSLSWLLLVGLSGVFSTAVARDNSSEANSKQDVQSVPVRVMKVQSQDLPIVVESVGRVYPMRSVTVTAEIPGKVARYLADVGDRVKEGQVLIEIDPTDYQLAYEEAQAALTAAQAGLEAAAKAHERAKTLLPRKVISPDSFDRIEAEYKAAQAQTIRAEVGVKAARERLNKTRLTAPFASLVAARYIEIGQMIGAGVPLMTLADLEQVKIKIYLAEQDYVEVDPPDPVRVRIEAYPDLEFNGRIGRIDIQADPMTNTFGIEVILDNKDRLLKAGLSARVYLTTRVLPEVILIPSSAVLFRAQDAEVFIVEPDGTAQARSVVLGQTYGGSVLVAKGLNPGESLIVSGQNYVKSGQKVTVKDLKNSD